MRFIQRKECWFPTPQGWLLLLAVFLGGAFAVMRTINPFLCVTSPVSAQVLIAEGWLPDSALKGVIAEFKRGGYRYVITSGGASPEVESRFHCKTWAEFAAANLERLGLPTDVIVPAPSDYQLRDRTYSAAVAAKQWLNATNTIVSAVNVYSMGVHARRSRLLFQEALGDKVKVGIIAHPDDSYDAAHWWRSSPGVREVIGEGIAYIYARLFFRPPADSSKMAFKQAMLLATIPACIVAVWFFRATRAHRNSVLRALLMGAVSAYGGSLLATSLVHRSALYGLLSGLAFMAVVAVASLSGAALMAVCVHANLYSDERPTPLDTVAVWLVVAGSVLVPLLVCL